MNEPSINERPLLDIVRSAAPRLTWIVSDAQTVTVDIDLGNGFGLTLNVTEDGDVYVDHTEDNALQSIWAGVYGAFPNGEDPADFPAYRVERRIRKAILRALIGAEEHYRRLTREIHNLAVLAVYATNTPEPTRRTRK